MVAGFVAPVAVAAAVAAARVLVEERRQRRSGGDPGPADALVVFGAGVREWGPTPELAARLDHAAILWGAGVAPLVLVSGGASHGLSEPDVMAAYLVALGVPASAVAPLVPGDNSRETVRSAVLQVGRGPRLLAVTSAYHARRVLDEGRRQGLILGAACPSRSPDVTTPQIHRARVAVDVVGVLVYALPKPWALVLRSAFGRWRPALSRAVGGRRAWNEPAYPQ